MYLLPRFVLLCAASIGLIACGGQTTGTTADGGPITPATNTTSLVGTWDITGSFTAEPSRKGSGILTLAKDEMLIVFGRDSLSYRAKGEVLSLEHTNSGRTEPVGVTRIGQPFDTGILPFALGGAWTFSDRGKQRCTAQIGSTTTTKCDGAARISPLPSLTATTTATRVATLVSVFGDLGGEWKVTTDKGSTCTLRFEGANVSIVCKGASTSTYDGSATLTFGDGIASGSTSTGYEFAAKRR